MLAFMEKCAAFRAMVAKTVAVIETELAKKVARLILIENVNVSVIFFLSFSTFNHIFMKVINVCYSSLEVEQI